MMKNLLLYLALGTTLLFSLNTQAQTVTGNITAVISDTANNSGGNTAMFVYNQDDPQNNYHPSNLPGSNSIDFLTYHYMDSVSGWKIFNYTANSGDTLLVGAFDCNYNFHYQQITAKNAMMDTVHIQVPCLPTNCGAITGVKENSTGTRALFEAYALVKEASNNPFTANHTWNFSDNVSFTSGPYPADYDSVSRSLNSMPPNLEYCYSRMPSCATTCDSTNLGTGTPGNPLTCNAHFYVDTVNSTNHQGQVVMWENSTTSAGNIVDYHWDFGDNTTYNSQYPTHTYNDTDIYNVCLTITAVDSGDTCTSTFCDSIGFDQNGNLVYKTEGEEGFTINVIDPETVGVEEASDQDPEFNLFPNPSSERATLTWNPDYNIRNIELIGMNGKLLRTLKANQSGRVEFNDLSPGVYIVRITGEDRVTPMKMIVK